MLNVLDLRLLWDAQGVGALTQYLRGKKENFTVYFSGKRRSLLHPNMAQQSFFPITIFSWENWKKNCPEKRA